MKKSILFLVLAFPLSTLAGKPDGYDHQCLANQKDVMVQASGGYWYSHSQSPDECRTHGTYYAVRLSQGNLDTNAIPVFIRYEETLERANLRKAKLEREYGHFCSNVSVTIQPIAY